MLINNWEGIVPHEIGGVDGGVVAVPVVGVAVTGGEKRRGRVDEHVEIHEVVEELDVFGIVVAAGHSPALQLRYAGRSPAEREVVFCFCNYDTTNSDGSNREGSEFTRAQATKQAANKTAG